MAENKLFSGLCDCFTKGDCFVLVTLIDANNYLFGLLQSTLSVHENWSDRLREVVAYGENQQTKSMD